MLLNFVLWISIKYVSERLIAFSSLSIAGDENVNLSSCVLLNVLEKFQCGHMIPLRETLSFLLCEMIEESFDF